MPQHFLSPDQLQDRPWRPGHPLNRNPSAKRRAMMLTLFVILCSIIGGYLYITDPKRVEKMAENELSRLIGGHITIGAAKLSLFEGLRLEQVKLYVDNQMEADSLLFSANAFHVNYDPRALLTGRLKLTQMVAIDPHVVLTENLDTGKWNYQRMRRPEPSPTDRTPGGPLPALPQIVLRNAQIDYSETLRGEQVSRGTMAIEGQLAPSSNGQVYTFELQSRGGNVAADKVAVGPTVTGSLDRDSGTVTAAMRDFKFGQDIRAMLPAQVRAWWDRHSLSGSVDIPILSYTPANGTDDAKYRVQTVFRDVDLTIRPEEWMSRDEIQTRDWTAAALDSLRAAGLNSRGVVDRIAQLVDPSPIHLGRVKGRFEFTEDGIILGENDAQGRLVSGVSGVLEENLFSIDGHIDGYSPLSPAHIKISSTRMQIPAHPRYVTSMPRQVRELYDHLRPQGICELQVNVDRPAAGARLEIAGGINIVDGNFIFDRFPYPVRAATGQIIFGYDPASGMDQVKIVNLRGRGMLGGPNANSIIQMGGLIRPLNSDAGVQITVSSNDVHDEPALKAAFPEDVRKALRNLDADGKGEYPKFNGGFECRVVRPIGDKVEWIIDVDITLNDSAGKMVAFPYLMEHVTGKLLIREGYVDIVGATMKKKDDASLVIDGRVTWRAGFGGRRLEPGEVYGHVTPSRPDLKITARNVPIDKDLLGALPEDRRTWLQSVGLTGLLDIDGRVWRPVAGETAAAKSASDSDLTHAFDIILRNGTIWPVEGTFAISNLAAKLRLLPDRMSISEMSAKRGDADIAGRGEISWPQNRPAVFVSGTASKLALDRTLYRILPHAAQSAWDAVKPEGVVDLDLTYSGAVGVAEDRVSGFGVRVSDKDKIAATLPSSPETPNPKPLNPTLPRTPPRRFRSHHPPRQARRDRPVHPLPPRGSHRHHPPQRREGAAHGSGRQARRRRDSRLWIRRDAGDQLGPEYLRREDNGRRGVPPRAAQRAGVGRAVDQAGGADQFRAAAIADSLFRADDRADDGADDRADDGPIDYRAGDPRVHNGPPRVTARHRFHRPPGDEQSIDRRRRADGEHRRQAHA
jgi:hypothetical protein